MVALAEKSLQEQHFNHAHHPCRQTSCLAQKFVVFGSLLDLKAHMVEEHGADMSARDKKDARRVQADFEFEEVGAGARRGRRDRGDREREREPPPTGPPRPNAAGARRREAFSGSLTANGSAPATPAGPSRQSPSPPTDDPAAAECVLSFNLILEATNLILDHSQTSDRDLSAGQFHCSQS